ncbi:claspin [Drosophila innubila]|uniref:claspin n=1 Tax=Drosophila innubila TaxID=198719 RepID=UPI00148D5984|nr:claspin [Drosophila innubila]
MSETVAETATAAENGEKENDSMEKLQVDDEDEKNVSVEDILGGNTLIMSDSEDDETPAPTGKQTSPKSRAQRLEDSDEECGVDKGTAAATAKSVQAEEELETGENVVPRPKKKVSAIIDSESEEEQSVEAKMGEDKEQDQEEKEKSKLKSKKKILAIIDSESEEEQVEAEEGATKQKNEEQDHKPKSKKKISAIIDTDSEEESQEEQQKQEKKMSRNVTKKKRQRMDSEKEENSASSSDEESSNKLKGIVDSESEAERSNEEEPMEQQERNDAPKDKSSKSKPMRATAKKALDAMQAIQSEQQRLQREAHISVPYHQPKPRTLKEFLSRRTINKPLAVAMAGGSPMPAKKEPRKSMALRMNSDELQAYAKLMEERAKEATEFFKSESEHEEDDVEEDEPMELKDNAGVLDTATESGELANEVEDTSAVPESESAADVPIDDHEANSVDVEAEIVPETQLIAEAISPSKVMLVTEVVELPKLDLSTLNITPPSKPSTPRITEAIRRLRDEKSCDVSPSLKGDANMVIDLETGDMFPKKPTGVDDLLQRLMKTREAKKHKTTETVNILSTSHGKLELSKVSIHLHEEEPVNKEQKPGAAFTKMQEQLKSLITKKRMEDMRKKQAEEMEQEDENEEMNMDEEYEPDEKPVKSQVIINDDEEIVDEETEQDAGDDEGAAESADEAEQEADAEDEVEAKDEEASSSNNSDEDSEAEENTQTGKRKNRIIRAFQDDNSDEEDVDLLQTPKVTNAAPITATQLQLSAHKLFDTEIERTASDEEKELLGLCSGRFTQSEVSSAAPTVGALISQIPITQATSNSQAPDELEALCSGSFETQPTSLPEPATNKILSSEEEPAEQLKEEKTRQKKLTKKRQKKKAKLGFSDDEESDEDSVEEEQLESEVEEAAEEVPESFVDYDSEENEVVVQMTKRDRKLRAANFVEKEAELSESEWGSADEDEKNMDTYDIELGDEDDFDKEKIRHELGQIHARKMLDQDIREVRKIQEMLFEDEEGAVRQRQFRWKNAENGAGFSLDESRNENADGDANEGSGDEENEHLWRKIRFEREQLLLEKGLKGETTGGASPLSPAVANTNSAGGHVRKLNIITAKKTNVELKKSSPFLISKSVNPTQQQTVRGSFLVRDKETLTKLAGLTKGGAGDVDGTAGTVSVKSAKAKNFVFATLTEEEHENQKRKAADLLNSSSETGVNFMKKPRLEPRREKCLIDQLL